MPVRYRLTAHAQVELTRRRLSIEQIEAVLSHPEQVIPAELGRFVYQSKTRVADGRIMLIRVVVERDEETLVVVTAYRTTKIEKYWRRT